MEKPYNSNGDDDDDERIVKNYHSTYLLKMLSPELMIYSSKKKCDSYYNISSVFDKQKYVRWKIQ